MVTLEEFREQAVRYVDGVCHRHVEPLVWANVLGGTQTGVGRVLNPAVHRIRNEIPENIVRYPW